MIIFKNKGVTGKQSPKEQAKQAEAEAKGGEDHEPSFIIKDFAQNYITYHIHKATAGERPPRHHNVVHASDIDPARKWCPREPALLTLHNKKRPPGFISTAQNMTFGMGYAGADLLIRRIPSEKVWGHWKCLACNHEIKFSYTPEHCDSCGGNRRALRYQEVLLRDPETGLVGSVDLFVDIFGNGIKTPVEIKTEGNDGFKARNKPEFDHEWRTMLYLWLIDRTPQVQGKGLNAQEGRVIYFTKEGYAEEPKIKEWKLQDWAKSAIKEYWTHRNDDMLANQLDKVKTYRTWRNYYDENPSSIPVTLPERISQCTSVGCSRARECPVRKECWKL